MNSKTAESSQKPLNRPKSALSFTSLALMSFMPPPVLKWSHRDRSTLDVVQFFSVSGDEIFLASINLHELAFNCC